MEHYIWENNPSKKSYVAFKQWPQKVSDEDVKSYAIDIVGEKYKEAVTDLFNNGKTNKIVYLKHSIKKISSLTGEDEYTLSKYREAVLAVLSPQNAQA